MAIIKPFKGVRPIKKHVHKVASKPYDVLNSAEARVAVKGNPYSFLHIIKSEVDLPEDVNPHNQAVYDKAKDNFDKFISDSILFQEKEECYYLYQQVMGMHRQIGLFCCSGIADYRKNIIKKHEHTRPSKEQDRINHIKTTRVHTGPVFLTYPDVSEIGELTNNYISNNTPEYDFTADDAVQHTVWVINDKSTIDKITKLFKTKVPFTYIADGHHRAASAYKVSDERKNLNPDHTGNEEYNYFLTVLFPANQLNIIDYNRIVKDLNGYSEKAFLKKISGYFIIERIEKTQIKPVKYHEFGMYLAHKWYALIAKDGTYKNDDPTGALDVSILQNNILSSILNINDPRTDERIDFVGGIRGLEELEERVDSGEMAVAFALYPVTIKQLINIADSGKVMPPKSTWFEPKLRSGIVSHLLD
ncbi:MAG: DUF1015 domain-containing protein [Cytophagales bacterium]|nr:DUF1015 domain-containing protein [Cytophagales bacterium]